MDRQMEVHGPKLCEEDLMFETVYTPQSWNSVASFNWSNADNLPSTPQFSPSRPLGFTINGDTGLKDRSWSAWVPQAVGAEFLHAKARS